mgnify:CR=1 FL=1
MFRTLLFLSIIITNSALAGHSPVVTQEQLLKLQAAPASMPFVLLDVRTKEEYEEGHIVGAINISHDILQQRLKQVSTNKQQAIIVYCRSGRRAAIAEELLRTNGFTNIRHLQGDMKLWQSKALPIVKSDRQ